MHLDLIVEASEHRSNVLQNLDQLGFELGRRQVEEQVLPAVQDLNQEPFFGHADLDRVFDLLDLRVFASNSVS